MDDLDQIALLDPQSLNLLPYLNDIASSMIVVNKLPTLSFLQHLEVLFITRLVNV